MITVAFIGLGNRGRIYAHQFSTQPDVKIVALCEKNSELLKGVQEKYGVAEDKCFTVDSDFFSAGKLADVLVIGTQDKDHYGHAVSALSLDYDLLLEKPVSPYLAECEEIARLAKERNRKVVVCHVLRYAGFYKKVKEVIDSGIIGEIVSVNDTENIGYWHYSHSYVRGNWRNEGESGPSILAKCCHDLDIIHYFTGKKCEAVSSSGTRKVFLPENAPEGATPYCLDGCPHRKDCVYDVRKIYFGFTKHTVPKMIVNYKLVTRQNKFSIKLLKEALKTSPYGRCVYKCDNDVIENQMVNMRLEGGVNANLTMTAFSKDCFRRLYISGTKGEIIGEDKNGEFKVNIFGKESKTVKIGLAGVAGHLGGDKMIVVDFVEYLKTGVKTQRLSTIETTLESHRIAFAAEESRKDNSKVIYLNK